MSYIKNVVCIIFVLSLFVSEAFCENEPKIELLRIVGIGDKEDQLYYDEHPDLMQTEPYLVGIRNGNVFVDDVMHSRIVVYDLNINILKSFSYHRDNGFSFRQPTLFVDQDIDNNNYFMFYHSSLAKTTNDLKLIYQVAYHKEMYKLNSAEYFMSNGNIFFYNKTRLNALDQKGKYFEGTEAETLLKNDSGWNVHPFTNFSKEFEQIRQSNHIYFLSEKLICPDHDSFIEFRTYLENEAKGFYKEEKALSEGLDSFDYLGHDKMNNIYWYNLNSLNTLLVYDKYCRLIKVIECKLTTKPHVGENGDIYFIDSSFAAT